MKNAKKYKTIQKGEEIDWGWDYIKVLHRLVNARKYLNTQGYQVFKNSIQNFEIQLKELSLPVEEKIIKNPKFEALKKKLNEITYTSIENHPKMQKLVEILQEYFAKQESTNQNSKVIVFTQNRPNALIIER